MKKRMTRMLAVLLAVLTVLSVSATFAFAAETDEAQEVGATKKVSATEPTIPVTVVGKVKNIVKQSSLSDRIKLSWKKVEGASGYSVYICNADKSKKFSKAGQVKSNSITITGLSQATLYQIKVAAFVTVKGKKYEGQTTLKKTATNPSRVTGVSKLRSSEVVQIRWDRNSKASGYKILRQSSESNNKEVLVKTITNPKTNTFTDPKAKLGGLYRYRVVAYRNGNGTVYNSSNNGTVRVKCGLGAPDFSISSKLYNVSMSWSKNIHASRYDIYYSTNPNAKAYTRAGSTTGTSYTIRKMTGNKKFYFRVYPIYKTGNYTFTGTAITKACTVSGEIYGETPGGSYVEISIAQQHMWCYKNGKLVVDTPVVTGMRNSMDTPKGYFSIFSRARNTYLTGPGYSSFVEYWMAFSGGCGIHDASWRSSSEYGGNTYTYNGSHGCVNTPKSAVQKVWNNTDWYTPVIVY